MCRSLLCALVVAAAVSSVQADWVPYANRYALIVMGGEQTGQLYTYYWTDTSTMYDKLKAAGFTDANIYFLSYGPSAQGKAIVDKPSTRTNVLWAFDQLAQRAGEDDLVYIFWVDHGDDTKFNVKDGDVTHAEFGQKVGAIKARQVLVALNPCMSGSALDDISRDGVCATSAVKPGKTNVWGWAGQWVIAITGGTGDSPSDANGDGMVAFAEAYDWVAQKSHAGAPAEHPKYDDNGDKVLAEQGEASFNMTNPSKDGWMGSRFSLTHQNRTKERAYLDYLIARKQHNVPTLSGFFGLNFASYKPSVVSQCVAKLKADLNFHKIVFVDENDFAVRQRQYLDYLILRRQQTAYQITAFFQKDFASTDWDTMAWCTRKLEMDLPVQGKTFRTAAQVEARDRAYLNYLIGRRGQSAAMLGDFFKISFSSQVPAEMWTCIRLLEKDLSANNITYISRPLWENSGAQGVPLVAPH